MTLTEPLFVLFEGIDGAGKSLQADRLARWLEDRDLAVVRTREPTDGPWGRKIRSAARRDDRPAPETEVDWFLADRREHVESVLKPALAARQIVVQDRYYPSTVAYQGARGLDVSALLKRNEAFCPRPDVTFLIDLPPEVALDRIAAGREATDAFETADYLTRVREVFLSISWPGLVVLDGTAPPDELQEKIRSRIEAEIRERLLDNSEPAPPR